MVLPQRHDHQYRFVPRHLWNLVFPRCAGDPYFQQKPELVQTATEALPLFALSFIPMAYNLIYTAFLFSTKRIGTSNVIAVSQGIVLKALAIFLLPKIAGTDAIWIALFGAESITLILAAALKKTSKLVYQ